MKKLLLFGLMSISGFFSEASDLICANSTESGTLTLSISGFGEKNVEVFLEESAKGLKSEFSGSFESKKFGETNYILAENKGHLTVSTQWVFKDDNLEKCYICGLSIMDVGYTATLYLHRTSTDFLECDVQN